MRILLADDDLTTRLIMTEVLSEWGYNITLASNGKEAWDALLEDNYPVAILDWMMPEMNGVEICSRFKKAHPSPDTYMILLSKKSEKSDIVTGLDAGADDFVVKPCDPAELRSRIRAGERIVASEKKLREQSLKLEKYAADMKRLAEERAKQLLHADRMATLGTLSAGIAHEINNPTSFISGNIHMVEEFWKTAAPLLSDKNSKGIIPDKKREFILREFPATIEGIKKGVSRIKRIVDGLTLYSRGKEPEHAQCNVADCIESALELCSNALKYHVTIENRLAAQTPTINADSQQIEQVFINLFTNAADAISSDQKGILTIEASHSDKEISIAIKDTGPGIPEDALDRIWNPFFTTKDPGKGTGLGLSIARKIIEDHDGTITARNSESKGAEFIVTLPINRTDYLSNE